jgi:adenosylhomocysteine nucleosidase
MKHLAVIAAMEEELSKFRDSLLNRKEIHIGGKTFYKGEFNGVPTVVVLSGWGKVASSSTASILLARFDIASLVFIGVAGATNPSLNIGDIVISTETYQHDMDATPLMPKYEIPSVAKTFFCADAKLKECTTACSQEFFANLPTCIPAETLTAFGITSPKAAQGVIASGDTFVTTKEDLRNLHPTVTTDAVEMEGAAVSQVCDAFNIPFVIIRTVSDKENCDAHIDFPKFIASVASIYSFEILTRMSKTPLLQAIAMQLTHAAFLPTTCTDIIAHLGLKQHIEGGYYKETHRSTQQIKIDRNGTMSAEPAGTAIQFLLNKDENGFSAWHRISDDEVWYYQAGQPMLIHYIDITGKLVSTLIGNPLEHPGCTNQLVVPHKCWFAAEVGANQGFSLVGCSVSPAFDFTRFELADRDTLIAEYPEHSDIIARLTQSPQEKSS